VAPLSPFFLASLLNASCTNTYAVDIPYFSCLLEDNTQEEGGRVVDSNSGSVQPWHTARSKDNTMITHLVTKPNITALPYHRSADRSEIFRDLPVLGGRSAAVPSDNHREFICHGDRFSAFGELCHPVRCKCTTSHLLEV
jgi:hypothetical protein